MERPQVASHCCERYRAGSDVDRLKARKRVAVPGTRLNDRCNPATPRRASRVIQQTSASLFAIAGTALTSTPTVQRVRPTSTSYFVEYTMYSNEFFEINK